MNVQDSLAGGVAVTAGVLTEGCIAFVGIAFGFYLEVNCHSKSNIIPMSTMAGSALVGLPVSWAVGKYIYDSLGDHSIENG